ncbi:MAG: response regulator [Elusimicrobia bacterium]|nr:response regulator [Elusimicrobiota bacterium]
MSDNGEPIKVLLIEDDLVSAKLVQALLAAAKDRLFTVAWVQTLKAALECLDAESFGVVVLDLNLPDSSGLATFTRLIEAVPDAAIVLMTHLDDEETALKAVQGGAQDYLIKGAMDAHGIVRSLRYAYERRRARAESERIKEEFLHHVSHELRSPLTAVYQAVQLIASGVGGDARPELKRLCAIASRNAEHLRAMVEDLLEATRAETGKLIVEPRRMDASLLAAEVAAEKRLAANERGVSLVCEGVPGAAAFADPVRVRQVLMNFVDNALKFTPSGGTVRVDCLPAPEPGALMLAVTDSGPGLPPEDARRIFDRLYQASGVKPASSERKGLGLGLYICREIVIRSGGRIWVETEQGKGASFRFTVPAFSFAGLAGSAGIAAAPRLSAAFVELYPAAHGLAESSSRTVRLECAAQLRRAAREGEALLPEMAPPRVEGVLVMVSTGEAKALQERLAAQLSGVRVLERNRLKAKVEVEELSAGSDGVVAALEAAVERRMLARVEAARKAGVIA